MYSDETIKIKEEVAIECDIKYSKKPTKKQMIMEVLEHQSGTISMRLLSKVMDYNSVELEKWVLRLHKENKVSIIGDYGKWTIIKLESDGSLKKCEQKCEYCIQLIDENDTLNLDICEFCGHYYIQNKLDTGYCSSCEKERRGEKH